MTVGVSISSINGTIKGNLANPHERGYRIKPRGEVIMAPQPENVASKTPHTETEEEQRKKRIFASYLEQRVL